jgi:anti-sigma B factor antagonist
MREITSDPTGWDGVGGLRIQCRDDARGALVELMGELDLESAPELDRRLRELEAKNPGRMLIDLRGVEFMDSSGLAAMIRALRAAQENGHTLTLRPGPSQVQRLFELTGVADLFAFER